MSNFPVDSWNNTQSESAITPLVCFKPPGTDKYDPGPNFTWDPPSGAYQNVPEITTSVTSFVCICSG